MVGAAEVAVVGVVEAPGVVVAVGVVAVVVSGGFVLVEVVLVEVVFVGCGFGCGFTGWLALGGL